MDTSTNQLSVADAEGVLALVPHMLGFHPEHSLVLLITSGSKLVAALRVDLPPGGASPFEERAHAVRVGEYLEDMQEATGAFLVTYSASPASRLAGRTRSPHRRVVKTVAEELGARSVAVPDAWHVGPDGWRSHYCTDESCCPEQGHPLESIWLSDANLELQFAGSAPGSRLWDGTPSSPWPAAATVRDMVGSILGGVLGAPDATGFLRRWCEAIEREPADALARLRSEPLETGILLAGLHDYSVRDVLPFAAATATADGIAVAGELDAGGEAPRQLAEVLLGSAESAPDWDRLDRLWNIGAELVAAADGEDRCALLCVLGWIEWARGRSSAAAALLDGCLAANPAYALAGKLKTFLDQGRLPRWARDPATAWRRGTGPGAMPGRET